MFSDFRLKVFLTLDRTGSFTLAAKQLGVSQPAVSQNITALEKELGIQLISRRKGEVSLTPAGLSFKNYAEKILYWYEAAEQMFGSGGQLTANRPVRIASDGICAQFILPKALSAVHAVHPKINFTIEPLSADTESNIADARLSVSPSPETMDFEGEVNLVGVMDAMVVCSPSNHSVASAAGAPDTSKPFSTIAGVHVSNGLVVWKDYLDLLSLDLRSRVSMVCESAQTLLDVVCVSDNLVGIAPVCSVSSYLSEGKLLQLPVSLPAFSFDIHYEPSADFAGNEISRLLMLSLRDSLKR